MTFRFSILVKDLLAVNGRRAVYFDLDSQFSSRFASIAIQHLHNSRRFAGAAARAAEAGGEVLLVADHHVDVPGDLAVDLLGLGLAADGLPQAGAVVQVVGDHGAVSLRRGDRLDRKSTRLNSSHLGI